MRLVVLVLVVAAVVAGWDHPRSHRSRTGAPPAWAAGPTPLTVEDVYKRVEQRLGRPGTLYRATIYTAVFQGPFSHVGTIEQWVDVGRNRAREEVSLIPWGMVRTLVTGEGRFVRHFNGRVTATSPATCHGVGVAASAVLGCPGPTERSTTAVQAGRYLGRPAIVLATSGRSSGSDETVTFARRLYLDPDTYLPIALEGSGEIDFGRTMPVWERRLYRHEVISSEGVSADFFDPARIGYAEPDLERPLDRLGSELTVYWLGRHFAGADDLPPLVLAKVHEPSGIGPGYLVLLEYASAEDRFGPPVVTLQLWPRGAWDAHVGQQKGRPRWEHPCWQREELALPAGRATIFGGYDSAAAAVPGGSPPETGPCPDDPPNSYSAQAYLGRTVVFAGAPGASSVRGSTRSPYDTAAGMAAIVRALQPRDAGR